MIAIDGSQGEGGGQIIRSALALALATGAPFRIDRIRARRAKPGLQRQHLMGVEAARQVGLADVEGAQLGATTLVFRPRGLVPGAYRFAIGSAGSTLLVLQAIVPALLRGGDAWQLELEGGTHNPMAPSFEFFARTLAPVLARMGAPVDVRLERAGFYPRGGGRLQVAIAAGGRLGGLELLERGAIRSRVVTAVVANLAASIGEREVAAATARLGWDAAAGEVVMVSSPGAGNAVAITVEHEHIAETFTAHGERGVPAEKVARAAADECAAYLAAAAPVGEYLADQLIVPMVLGEGGRFVATVISEHTRTLIEVVRQFVGVEIVVHDLGHAGVEVVVPAARR